MLFFIINIAFAKTVTPERAKEVAISFFNSTLPENKSLRSISNLQLVYTENLNNFFSATPAYYIFNNTGDKGFVIIAGNDNATPIVGYSHEGTIDINNMSPAFLQWMNGYKKFLLHSSSKERKVTNTIALKWNPDYYSKSNNNRVRKNVTKLLYTEWSQGKYYNSECKGKHTGCVATALGQIMKHWAYPGVGQGCRNNTNFYNTDYYWCNMPKKLDRNSSNKEVRSVATLLRDCGMSVDMNYEADHSSAHTEKTVHALKEYFGYHDDIKIIKEGNYSKKEWRNLFKTQLDKRQPIIMRGGDTRVNESGGHAWVCDGYDNNERFNMNWGWGGKDDGYFDLYKLEFDDDSNYNKSNYAIINIKPPSNRPGYTVDGEPSIFANYKFIPHSGSTIQILENGKWVNKYNYSIHLHDGETREITSRAFNKIGYSGACTKIYRSYKDTGDWYRTEKNTNNSIVLYPNPTSNELHINSTMQIDSINCFSISGNQVSIVFKNNKISVKDLPTGLYFLRIINAKNEVITRKFIKK